MAADESVNTAGAGVFKSIGLARIVRLLRYLAGDPALADRAIITSDAIAVADTAAVNIADAQDESQDFSIAELTFTSGSGSARYSMTRIPTAAGFGVPFAAGGGRITIRGTWNIRKFQIIAETGQTLSFTYVLYKTPVWSTGLMVEKAS